VRRHLSGAPKGMPLRTVGDLSFSAPAKASPSKAPHFEFLIKLLYRQRGRTKHRFLRFHSDLSYSLSIGPGGHSSCRVQRVMRKAELFVRSRNRFRCSASASAKCWTILPLRILKTTHWSFAISTALPLRRAAHRGRARRPGLLALGIQRATDRAVGPPTVRNGNHPICHRQDWRHPG